MSLQVREDRLPNVGKASLAERVARLFFALAVLATIARLMELAAEPAATVAVDRPVLARPPALSVRKGAAFDSLAQPAAARVSADAELAQLYAHCPTAELVSLEEVATSPEKVDALLPPFRPTVAHGSELARSDRLAVSSQAYRPAKLPPAVPRIRYPVALRPPGPQDANVADSSAESSSEPVMRVAQAPRVPAAAPVADGWLIDPSDWYTPEELAEQSGETTPADVPPRAEEAPPASKPTKRDGSAHDSAVGTAAEETTRTNEPTTPDAETTPTAEPPESESGPIFSFDSPPTPVEQHEERSVAEEELPVGELGEPVVEATEVTPVDTPSSPWQPPKDAPPSAPITTKGIENAPSPAPPASDLFPAPVTPGPQGENGDVDPHLELFAKNNYPSARECAACHEEIYEQWSVSAHAYAAVSPMFQKFEQKLNDLSQGTVGYFCMRCHAPVATALCASRAEPLWNLPEVAREGITCIACHRVKYVYGKSNGERRIEPGDVFAPVYGGIGGEGVAEAIDRKDEFKVKTSPDEKGPGQNIHVAGIYFDPLTRSEACTPCHQVAVHPGIKLEVVWEQYRASPACKKGIQCQDCHMGRVPGLPLGYDVGAIAKVNGKTVSDQRKKSNHMFHGPNYSIAHPGVFPFHLKASRWSMEEWLTFDWRAGWGTDEFEDRVADGEIAVDFPPCWAEADDRYDARDILDDNFKKLELKRENRRQVMENGSRVEGPFFDGVLCRGEDIKFHYLVTNTNEGHNLLTASLGAQPQLWANIVLIGPDGRRLWETGYTDSYGDLANIHSEDVRHGRVPFDWQLFNLQTMFLITGAKGTDREFFVPVNLDIDQLPFIRPGVQPISVINHPPFIRMESQSLAALGSRKVPYRIPGELIQQPGKYRLSFRMRNRAEPIYFMRFCEATPEMQRMMNEWMIDVHPMSVEFEVR